MQADRPRDAAARLLVGLSRATVLVAMAEQLPYRLIGELLGVARKQGVELTLLVADLSGQWCFLDARALEDVRAGRLHLRLVAGGVPASIATDVDQVVGSMWDIDRAIGRGDLVVDIFLARVGTGRPGRATFGDMVGYGPTALSVAERVGLEVVEGRWPRYSDEVDFDLEIATTIVVGTPPVPATESEPTVTAAQREVARRVAALVPNGATLQTGLGAVPAALFDELGDHEDLGVHSGILPVQLQGLIASGAVTGRLKNDDVGRHVATGVLGGVLGGIDSMWGTGVRLEPITRTHDPVRLRGLRALWAVNSAFEIDLAGQINAEFIHGCRIASGGGQTDFLRAARLSPDGAAVLALPARAPRGRPRIVSRLPGEHVPSTTAAELDWVVTDHGAACMRGLTVKERAEALIAVAHPEDRQNLRQALSTSTH